MTIDEDLASLKTPLPSTTRYASGTMSPVEEKLVPSSHKTLTGNPTALSHRKDDKKMPSPLGRVPVRVEGQVNMPNMTLIRERSIYGHTAGSAVSIRVIASMR